MKYKYYIVDVFTATQFAGNQLAVLPEATGISAAGMQKIAREFNFAETAFVLPPADPEPHLPGADLHARLGTALRRPSDDRDGLRACNGRSLRSWRRFSLTLEEGVGPVGVEVERRGEGWSAVLTLKGGVERPDSAPNLEDIAAVLSLQPDDVVQAFFAASDLRFCFAQLASAEAVDRAVIDKAAWTRHLAQAWSPSVFFFSGEPADGAELYARMCAPKMGIDEDPATGSACAALIGVMADRSGKAERCGQRHGDPGRGDGPAQ